MPFYASSLTCCFNNKMLGRKLINVKLVEFSSKKALILFPALTLLYQQLTCFCGMFDFYRRQYGGRTKGPPDREEEAKHSQNGK